MKPHSRCASFGFAAFAALLIGIPAEAVAQYTFTDLRVPGYGFQLATGVNGGQHVGWGTLNPEALGTRHAFLWSGTAESVVELRPAGYGDLLLNAVAAGMQVGRGDAHALLFRGTSESAVDLHPSGFTSSEALGVDGIRQVGKGIVDPIRNESHALLWTGTAESVIDLHPAGFTVTVASGVAGGAQQVGWGSGNATGGQIHALLWSGSADSVIDLNPDGFTSSKALDVDLGQQVGYGVIGNDVKRHALLWTGSAGSFVDLTPAGDLDSAASGVANGKQVGNVGGRAVVWTGTADSIVDLHAFLPSTFIASAATAIAGDGSIVGVANEPGQVFVRFVPVLWVPDGAGGYSYKELGGNLVSELH